MPSWALVLLGVFLVLGLRARPKWNVNAVAVAATVVVIFGVSVKEHLF